MILFAVTITAGCYVLLERGYGHEKVFLLYDALIGFFVISLLFGRQRSAVYTSYQRVTKNKQTQKKGQEQPLGFAINVLIVV